MKDVRRALLLLFIAAVLTGLFAAAFTGAAKAQDSDESGAQPAIVAQQQQGEGEAAALPVAPEPTQECALPAKEISATVSATYGSYTVTILATGSYYTRTYVMHVCFLDMFDRPINNENCFQRFHQKAEDGSVVRQIGKSITPIEGLSLKMWELGEEGEDQQVCVYPPKIAFRGFFFSNGLWLPLASRE